MCRRVRSALRFLSLALALLVTGPAHGWILNEHTRITREALAQLGQDPDYGLVLVQVLPQVMQALRLCPEGSAGCPSAGVLPSLAGDHSCTPRHLSGVVSASYHEDNAWIGEVLEIADEVHEDLKKVGPDRGEREALRRQMHLDLQAADASYVKNAILDYAHFQLPREDNRLGVPGLVAYLELALAPEQQANATAAYVNFHVVAVRLAAEAHAAHAEKQALLARAFVAEAFALHFLEDSFSAGHFVGHWGGDAVRLGTHDHYGATGVEALRWGKSGQSYIAHGDAFLSDAETRIAADAVSASLAQVLSASRGNKDIVDSYAGAYGLEEYDTCVSKTVPPGLIDVAQSWALQDVLQREPIPSLRDPEVARFHAEQGLFFGGVATLSGGLAAREQPVSGRWGASFRIGYGAAGLVNDPLNAQGFLEVGVVGERLVGDGMYSLVGFSARVRAPGPVTLADGVVAMVLAQLFRGDCPTCLNIGAFGARGGVLGIWKSRPITGSLAWQISALHDVTANWYPQQPYDDKWRLEFLPPLVTFRYAVPMTGDDSWSQSTDLYFDVGPSLTFTQDHRRGYLGAFASLAVAGRLFPLP